MNKSKVGGKTRKKDLQKYVFYAFGETNKNIQISIQNLWSTCSSLFKQNYKYIDALCIELHFDIFFYD